MRFRWIAAVAVAVVVAVALLLSAASYEVLSLGASLTHVVRELGGRPAPSLPPVPRPAPRAPGPPPGPGEATSAARQVSVRFTLGEVELSRMLRRDDHWLGRVLTVTREVSCRLDDGHVTIETRNTVDLAGRALGTYRGFSDWSLTALPRGLGVRLNALRLAGVAVPGASWLVRRFGPSQDGWFVVPTGSRNRVERVEVDDGKLHVSGTLRGPA